jgi:putative transposase
MRRPAINAPSHAHMLTFSCYRRYKFLAKERTCQWLADAINEARCDLGFQLWAYVFMPEHAHLLIWPQRADYDVRAILQAIKAPVGRKAIAYLREAAPAWLPRITTQKKQRVRRYFWQPGGGFDSNECEPRAIFGLIDYIHSNPERRQLVVRPEEWRWSSAGWHEGKNWRPTRWIWAA